MAYDLNNNLNGLALYGALLGAGTSNTKSSNNGSGGNSGTNNNTGNNSDNNKPTVEVHTRELGIDVAKYQPTLQNATGEDRFCIAQVGGYDGGIYYQQPYQDQIRQGNSRGLRMHTYIWLSTGADQSLTKYTLDTFLPKIGTPKGSIVALDYETQASGSVAGNTANVIYGMRRIAEAGYTPVLYSGHAYLSAHLDTATILAVFPNSIWVASYPDMTSIKPDMNYFPSRDGVCIWQYSSSYGWDKNIDLTGITYNGYTGSTNTGGNTNTGNQSGNNNQPQYQDTYTVSYGTQNVRTSPNTSASISGTLDNGDTISYLDKVVNDGYTWLHYKNYGGEDRYTIEVTEAPQQTTGGAYTVVSGAQNVRDAPSVNGTITGTLNDGDTITYTDKVVSEGYTWLHYKNFNGYDRYTVQF